MALSLYMMQVAGNSLRIAHIFILIFMMHSYSNWHDLTHHPDRANRPLLQNMYRFTQRAIAVYKLDHRWYHISVEIFAVLRLSQSFVQSAQLEWFLTSQVVLLPVSFTALYIALAILIRGLAC